MACPSLSRTRTCSAPRMRAIWQLNSWLPIVKRRAVQAIVAVYWQNELFCWASFISLVLEYRIRTLSLTEVFLSRMKSASKFGRLEGSSSVSTFLFLLKMQQRDETLHRPLDDVRQPDRKTTSKSEVRRRCSHYASRLVKYFKSGI